MPPRRSRRDPSEGHSKRSYLVHGKFLTRQWDYQHHVIPPISSSVTYRLENPSRAAHGFCGFADPKARDFRKAQVYIYDRLDEPTRAMLEDRLAFSEGGETALCFATGMAAIAAALGVLVRAGDEIVAHRTLYGCTYSLLTNWLARFGVRTHYADLTRPGEYEPLLRRRAVKAVYFETPINPTMELIDIADIARRVKRANRGRPAAGRIRTVIDNTFATPFCQRPLEHGADLVVHSLTKNIGGFGTDMGGAVIAPRELESDLLIFRKDFGSPLSSKNAWPILVYGLPSLDLRVRKEEHAAHRIARFLEGHPKVSRVAYPGLASFPQLALAKRQMRDFDGNFAPGSMIYFVLGGSAREADRRADRLIRHVAKHAYTITLAVSLGQIRTLIEKPSSMTHAVVPGETQAAGRIDPGGIRLSVGIEDVEDIVGDLAKALKTV